MGLKGANEAKKRVGERGKHKNKAENPRNSSASKGGVAY